MKQIVLVYSFVLALLCVPLAAQAQIPPVVISMSLRDSETFAAQNATLVQKISRTIHADNAADYGFDGPVSAADIQIGGPPLPVAYLSLEELKANPQKALDSLGLSFAEYLSPVYAHGKLACMIVQYRKNGQWQFSHFGSRDLARKYFPLRDSLVKNNAQNVSTFYALEVPGHNLQFLSQRFQDSAHFIPPKATLIPMYSNSQYGVQAKTPVDAGQLFNDVHNAR